MPNYLDRLDAIKRQKEELQRKERALTAQLQNQNRKLDTRRKIIIGSAVLAHADLDPTFAAALRTALDKAVTRGPDRDLIGDILSPAAVVAADNGHDSYQHSPVPEPQAPQNNGWQAPWGS